MMEIVASTELEKAKDEVRRLRIALVESGRREKDANDRIARLERRIEQLSK